MSNLDRTKELLNKLVGSKQNLVAKLVEKGESASMSDSFDSLTQKAGEYIPKTYIFVDENGKEVVGVLVEERTVFDATDNDVREGKVYAGDTGPSTGTKVIPAYHAQTGDKKISSGSDFKITFYDSLDLYDFTKLQIVVCLYSDSIANSVQAVQVVIGETLYDVNSTEPVATVTKDPETKTINLGITNDSENAYVLRYFTYKEIY